MAHRGLTGVLLVGGASTRFGSPKALATLGGETLAARGWRVLGETCEERLAVGKRVDALALPFPVLDDGTETRAPIAGVVAGIRAARNDLCVVLPVDCPLITGASLRRLADACADAAVSRSGPLPGAYRRSVLPILERRLLTGRLALHEALPELDVHVVPLPADELANVNETEDLRALSARLRPQDSNR